MKKGKRLVAVLLAMVMMLSTMSAAMVAFAAEINAKDAFDKVAGELSKYVPENFDKAKAEESVNDLLTQVKNGINALAAEEVEDTTDYTNDKEAKAFLTTLTKNKDGKTAKPFSELTDEEIKTALKWYEGQKEADKLSKAGNAAQGFKPIALNLFVKNFAVPENEVDTTYVPMDVQYPQGASYDAVEGFLTEADPLVTELLLGLLGSDAATLNEALANMLYTGSTVKAIVSMLYPMLAQEASLAMFLDPYPLAIAKTITDDETQWATLKNQLTEIGGNGAKSPLFGFRPSDPNGEAYVRYLNSDVYKEWVAAGKPGGARNAPSPAQFYWDVFNEANLDFGFEDGDKEGFIAALSMFFRPLAVAEAVLRLIPSYNQSEWDYFENDYSAAYDSIASILQFLGAENVMESRDYFLTVGNTIIEKGSTAIIEAPIALLLNEVFTFVEKIAANPATELMNLLPKLAYGLESGFLDAEFQEIKKYAGVLGFLGLPIAVSDMSLTTEGAFDLVRALASPDGVDAKGNPAIVLNDLAISGDTTVDVIVTKADFVKLIKDLAGCGRQLVVEDSVTLRYTKLAVLESNQPDAFVTFFRWTFKLLTGNVLAYTIENSIASGTITDPAQLIALQAAAFALRNMPADPALVAIVNAVNPPAPPAPPTLPDDGEDDSSFLDKIIGGIGDIIDIIFGGGNGGNNNGGNGDGDDGDDGNFADDPDIPETAGQSAGAALASVVVLAAVGAGVTVIAKRKHEDE